MDRLVELGAVVSPLASLVGLLEVLARHGLAVAGLHGGLPAERALAALATESRSGPDALKQRSGWYVSEPVRGVALRPCLALVAVDGPNAVGCARSLFFGSPALSSGGLAAVVDAAAATEDLPRLFPALLPCSRFQVAIHQ